MIGMDREIGPELSAEMRLAFTRATAAFPRVNMTPIAIVVHNVFADVFYELKRAKRWSVRREFRPLDEKMIQLMSELVDKAKSDILCRNVPLDLTRGLPALEAKNKAMLVSGLDRNSALILLEFAKSPTVGYRELLSRRQGALLNRRNMLANQLVRDAMKTARVYFLSEVANEPDTG